MSDFAISRRRTSARRRRPRPPWWYLLILLAVLLLVALVAMARALVLAVNDIAENGVTLLNGLALLSSVLVEWGAARALVHGLVIGRPTLTTTLLLLGWVLAIAFLLVYFAS